MIRLLKRLGRFPAGTETDYFDAAAEAAFVLDGTAERIEPESTRAENARMAEQPDYAHMKKSELVDEALARGLDVSPRARVGELVDALEADDAGA